jgi:hypothetical protein
MSGTIVILSLVLLFVATVFFITLSELVAFLRTRVPFVPTSKADIEFIVKKLSISSRDVFYDLGSGNGKVVFLVNQMTGARCLGFELSWWTVLFAKIKKWRLQRFSPSGGDARVHPRAERVQFKNKNFFKEDWSGANIIYGYLYPPLMGRIEEKFLADCKPGSTAIIRDFPFPRMPYSEKFYLPHKHEIYIYKK